MHTTPAPWSTGCVMRVGMGRSLRITIIIIVMVVDMVGMDMVAGDRE